MQDAMIARVSHIEVLVEASRNRARRVQPERWIKVSAEGLVCSQDNGTRFVRVCNCGCFRRPYSIVPDLGGDILANVKSHLVRWHPRAECHARTPDGLCIFCIVAVEPDIEDASRICGFVMAFNTR